MDADYSIELGPDDPALDFPWNDPAGELAYVDVKRHPDLISRISEVQVFPELEEFLRTVNSARSILETAKCDAWATTDLNAEEEIYDASHKFVSYVDVVFSDIEGRIALPAHEDFAGRLVELERRAPEIPSSVEVCVRRCYFEAERGVRDGFYFTLYVNGYGNDELSARQNWGIGLKVLGNAIVQLSAGGDDG